MTDVTPLITPPVAQSDSLVAKPGINPLNRRNVQSAKEMDKASQDFEAVYLSQMMSHMYTGIESDPNFGGGMGEDTMRSFLVNEYGKQMAAGGGIGIAKQMKQQLMQMQDVNPEASVLPDAAVTPKNNAEAVTDINTDSKDE